MEIFPGDDLTASDVSDLIEEIKNQHLLTQYEAENAQYWHINGWKNLQKIEKPTYYHPAFHEQSPNGRLTVGEFYQTNKQEVNKQESESNARAHENENQNQNQKPDTPTPPDPYAHCLAQIRQWGRDDGEWNTLLEYAKSVNYNPSKYGPVNDEVQKFTAYWLDTKRHPDDRAAFQADPARFFQEKGRKWLLDAKNMNRPKKDTRPKYEPPPNARQRQNGNAIPTTTIGDLAGKIITTIGTDA